MEKEVRVLLALPVFTHLLNRFFMTFSVERLEAIGTKNPNSDSEGNHAIFRRRILDAPARSTDMVPFYLVPNFFGNSNSSR